MSEKDKAKVGDRGDRGDAASPGGKRSRLRKVVGVQDGGSKVLRVLPRWLYDMRWLFGYALFLGVALYATARTGWDKGVVKTLFEWSFYGLLIVLCPGVAAALLDKMLSALGRRQAAGPPEEARPDRSRQGDEGGD